MGEESDQRKATGIYGYVKPKDAIRKNYNKEALELLENKKAQLTLEMLWSEICYQWEMSMDNG